MKVPLEPYLAIFRSQLETALWPREGAAAQKLTHFMHRVLTQLQVQQSTLPGLQQKALADYRALVGSFKEVLGADAAALDQHARVAPDWEQLTLFVQQAIPRIQKSAHPAAAKLLGQVMSIELELQSGLDRAAQAGEMKPVQDQGPAEALSSDQKRKLEDYLRRTFPSETGLEISGIRPIPGGFSKSTTFLDLKHNKTLPDTVVLRADRADSPVGTTVVDEFKLIQVLFESGVPVPRPFAVESDAEILGGPFLIVEKIDGGNIGDAMDIAQPSREFGVSLAHNLAKLHQVPPELVGDRLHGAGLSTRERMLADIADFESKWRSLDQASIAMETAFGWLRSNVDLAGEGARSIVHRDVGCHNMLVKDQRLAALLDWETAVIGNPAQDLAYVYHTAVQLMPWDDFLAEYAKAGGHVPSTAVIDFYRVWRSVWVMTFQMMVRSFVLNGLSNDIAMAYASQYLYQRLNHGLHEILHQVIAG